ncbi:ATP-binding cassette domain-containing protein [Litorivicinus lipolyticus]|uniref:ATP-binding cassette domain-containing protein n=1 Tax=Litorivicinus lipolyticus TaxID=418701 RepID=A0A5Q2QCW9_9GAMM|nr:ABC transporter ATP-binding protein [Litorivicinus lipolyticus]QGG79817.1 ATP-binding cassette domain-containing protein [Litorivicinus lipolyticus]
MLSVDALRTSFDGQANVIDFQLAPGQVLVVLGPNGAGKSWLMRTLAGLNPVMAGAVRWHERSLADCTDSARIRAFLSQEEARVFPMTVFEQVLSARAPWLQWHQSHSVQDEQKARESLVKVDMLAFADRMVDSLSGGEWQRVRLAGLLAQDTPLWLLDEPTEHLDPKHIWDTVPGLVRAHCRASGSVVLVGHDPDWAARLADQVVFVSRDGWEVGSASAMLTEPKLSALYGHRFVDHDGRWVAG